MLSMAPLAVLALVCIVVFEAVRFCRYRPTPLPTKVVSDGMDCSIFNAMKSIGGR